MKKYGTPTKMISARISEDNIMRLKKMSEELTMSKNELINESILQMSSNHRINRLYRQAESLGEDMDKWSRDVLMNYYHGKNLAVKKLHHK